MPAVIDTRGRDFEATLASARQPVLVDFSASWCGPCQAMEPALESFAEHRQNDLTVVRIDIDEAPDVAAKYAIRSVPTMALFHHDKLLARRSGMMSEAQLTEFVDQHAPRHARTVSQDPTRPQIDLEW